MKLPRIALIASPLALAATLWLSGPALRAQEPAQSQETHQAPAPSGSGEEAKAAEHGGAEAGAHHGPEVKLFGKVLGPGAQFGVKLFNFAVFAGLLYGLLKGILSAAFKARAKELEDQLAAAEREKSEADAQIRELEARVAGMQAELDGILARSEADAEAEKQRILEAARSEAGQIFALAQQEIDSQKRLAEKELRALVAELAVEGATRRLEAQVQGALASRMIDVAVEKVGGIK